VQNYVLEFLLLHHSVAQIYTTHDGASACLTILSKSHKASDDTPAEGAVRMQIFSHKAGRAKKGQSSTKKGQTKGLILSHKATEGAETRQILNHKVGAEQRLGLKPQSRDRAKAWF
jgi:hypothetical protein